MSRHTRTIVDLAQVRERLAVVCRCRRLEVRNGLLQIFRHAQPIAVHETESVVRLAVALSHTALEPQERLLEVLLWETFSAEIHLTKVARS